MTVHLANDVVGLLCERLRQASSAAAYEAMGKSGDVSPAVHALVPDVLCVGPAYTVRTPAGSADEIVQAVDHAPTGSVIVIDTGPGTEGAPGGDACTWGGTATLVAQRRGVAGVVSNGVVRDLAAIRRARFPVFARGTAVGGWRSGLRGAAGVPVVVGGRIVHEGDLVCADDDGVAIIPRGQAAQVLEQLLLRLQFEAEADRIAGGGGSYADVMRHRQRFGVLAQDAASRP